MRKQVKNSKEYEVQKILDSRIRANNQKLYLIRWKGFSQEYDTWQPIEHLIAVKEQLKRYQILHFEEAAKKIKEKRYKSKKIRKRFETMRIQLLQTKMRSVIQKINQARPAERRRISMYSLSSRKRKLIKRSRKRRRVSDKAKPLSAQTFKKKKTQLIEEVAQQVSVLNQKSESKQELMLEEVINEKPEYNSQAALHLEQIKPIDSFLNCIDAEQKEKVEKRNTYSHQRQNSSEYSHQSREDQQSEQQNIQILLINRQKIKQARIIFMNNSMFFDIPCKKQGNIQWLRLSRQQIMKINPGWLCEFFEGFCY